MIIDTITFACGVVVLLLALATPMLNPFFRKLHIDSEKNSADTYLPPLSVILTTHHDAQDVEQCLTALLAQDYESGFEIIVIAEKGDTETENVLKRFSQHPNLYFSFIPSSSRYMSRKKLAITLGVKAAKNEWIIMTETCSIPHSVQWLHSMGTRCRDGKSLVLGYSNYSHDVPAFARFERLRTSYYLFRKAQKRIAYRTNGTNIAFRKSDFVAQDGYRGNLHVVRGEYDFLVNKYAKNDQTAVALSSDAWIRDHMTEKKARLNKSLFDFHTRKFLQRSTCLRLLYHLDLYGMYFSYLITLGMFSLSLYSLHWAGMALSITSLLFIMIWRTCIACRAIKYFDERIPFWKVVPFELYLPWYHLGILMRYLKSDKLDFTTHKL